MKIFLNKRKEELKMIHEKVFYPIPSDESVVLTSYLHDRSPEYTYKKRPCMLVLPGGGYEVCSDREAEPIALAYMNKGFNAFVLRYSLKSKAVFPRPLIDALLSVKFIKDHAEEYNIDPNQIFAVGFSAGGHLCAALGTFWNDEELKAQCGFTADEGKVAGTILAYPVITGGKHAHRGSIDNVIGDKMKKTYGVEKYSIENQVHAQSAPAFIWHTFEDNCVPVENSLLMASALRRNNVPFEMHIFTKGCHGLSLSNEQTSLNGEMFINREAEVWFDMSVKWMNVMMNENK